MKTGYLKVIVSAILIASAFLSCKKGTTESITPSLIVGRWYIHHIYLRAYHNQVLFKDSTLHNDPHPENYVLFNGNGTLEYKFNKATPEVGTYQLHGHDSVYATIGNDLYKWQIDLLISTNCNVQTTKSDYPFPGYQLETYQSFIRN